jgi:hypothetical protein
MSDDPTAKSADDSAPFAQRRVVRLLIGAGITAALIAVIVIIVVGALRENRPPPGLATGEPVPCPTGAPTGSTCIPGNNSALNALDTLAQSGEYQCGPFPVDPSGNQQLSCGTNQTKVTGDPTLTDGTAFTADLAAGFYVPNFPSGNEAASGFIVQATALGGFTDQINGYGQACTALSHVFTTTVDAVFPSYRKVRSDLADHLPSIITNCVTHATEQPVVAAVVDGYVLRLRPAFQSADSSGYIAEISVDATH